MQISSLQGKRIFTVNRTEDVPEHLKTLHVVGTAYQNLVFKATINLNQNVSSSGFIPVADIPSGIVTITLFDNNWNAVAERIIFVNNKDYLFPVQMTVNSKTLSKKGRNEIELAVPDSVSANFSISVTDANLKTDSSNNIISHLLLTSELKGNVFNPSYYFRNPSFQVDEELDLVMLTNGWRRFKWEDVVEGKYPLILYPKDSTHLTLSGKISGLTSTQIQKNQNLILMVKGKDSVSKMLVAPVAMDGSFRDPHYLFFDSLRVYYQINKEFVKAKLNFMTTRLAPLNHNNKVITPFFPDTTGIYHYAAITGEAASMVKKYNEQILEGVTVTARKKTKTELLDEKYTSGLFTGWDARLFDLVNDPNALASPNIFIYMMGMVAGLQVSQDAVTQEWQLAWRSATPALYLDGFPTEPDVLATILPKDVALIKVFRPPFMGSRGFYGNPANGAIAIYTKKGDDALTASDDGMPSVVVTGYSPIREFYSPDYSVAAAENGQPDVRTTLYWKPQINLGGAENKIKIEFFNSDVQHKALRVIVEGVTKDGRLTHFEQVIN